MGEQLYKKIGEQYIPITALNFIQNIIDKESKTNLVNILNIYNHIYVPFIKTVEDTRLSIPNIIRRYGLWITYNKNGHLITEFYKNSQKEGIIDINWSDSKNWEVVPDIEYVNDASLRIPNGGILPEMLSPALQQLLANGNTIYNLVDDEDLTSTHNIIKFKDRKYSPILGNGLGYKILRKNWENGINILKQEMINEANTIYEIRYDFDINGVDVKLLENCILIFKGGSIVNTKNTGKLILDNTKLDGKIRLDVLLAGSIENQLLDARWYFKKSLDYAMRAFIDAFKTDSMKTLFWTGALELSEPLHIPNNWRLKGDNQYFASTIYASPSYKYDYMIGIFKETENNNHDWVFRQRFSNFYLWNQCDKVVDVVRTILSYSIDFDYVYMVDTSGSRGNMINARATNGVNLLNCKIFGNWLKDGVFADERANIFMVGCDIETLSTGINCASSSIVNIFSHYTERCVVTLRANNDKSGAVNVYGGIFHASNYQNGMIVISGYNATFNGLIYKTNYGGEFNIISPEDAIGTITINNCRGNIIDDKNLANIKNTNLNIEDLVYNYNDIVQKSDFNKYKHICSLKRIKDGYLSGVIELVIYSGIPYSSVYNHISIRYSKNATKIIIENVENLESFIKFTYNYKTTIDFKLISTDNDSQIHLFAKAYAIGEVETDSVPINIKIYNKTTYNDFQIYVQKGNLKYDDIIDKAKVIYTGVKLSRGLTKERPIVEDVVRDFHFYDVSLHKDIIYDNLRKIWLTTDGNPADAKTTGNTEERPSDVNIGYVYRNTQTNMLEMFNGSGWTELGSLIE